MTSIQLVGDATFAVSNKGPLPGHEISADF
jgi:hypothetical protein